MYQFLKKIAFATLLSLVTLADAGANCGSESWVPENESWTPNSRFQISDKEVFDKETGLTWKRCAEGMTWTGNTCKGEPSMVTWDVAMDHYNGEGQEWRLPNKDELSSIRAGEHEKSGCWAPAFNTDAFPGHPRVGSFWSSLLSADSNFHAWYVDFYFGNVSVKHRYDRNQVRLVRDDSLSL